VVPRTKKSEAIRVYAYERNGEWRCEVMRGDSVRRVVEIKDRRPEILNFRPAVADHLRYEPATGRLGIATRSPRLVQMYRELLGSMLATDRAFFSNENICTLRPLQQQGRSLFEQHRVPGIVRVDVVELRWRRGDRDKVWVTGPDCFKILDDLQARVQVEGELVQAKLLVWFAGAGRRGQVTITVPGRIEINAGAREQLVERLLDEVGLRGTFGPDSERLDLWSLHPWRQREDLWRRHLGAEAFDRLLRDKALRPARLEAVPHPDHPGLEGALATEDLDGSATIGVSDDPAIAVRTLTSSDVMGYELDVSRVATDIARGSDSAQTWARAGLSYVLRQDDATDDRLGLVGLLDDLYVVETAVRFIQPGRAPLDAILRELFSAWPFLLDVVLAEGDDAKQASEFLLLNLAFACPDLVEKTDGVSRLAVSGPGTGPLPLLVGFLAALGEQQRHATRPTDRFAPGQLVLVDGGACAVYRGRKHDQAGAPRIVLEFPSHTKRAGPVTHMLPLWAESRLTPAPSDRRPSGEMPRLGLPEARPVGLLQRLFHLDEPMIPNPAARKVLVVGDRLKARRLATGVSLGGQRLVEVLPIGHLNRRGEVSSWSQSAFGAQEPLIIISSAPERAAAFVEDRVSDIAVVIVDGDCAESADAELRRLADAQVPILAFLRDDAAGAQTAALLEDCGARGWRWRADDLDQMHWHSARGKGPISTIEQRAEASARPDIRTISVESAHVSEAFELLRNLGSANQDDDDQIQPLVGQVWGIGLELVRSVVVLDGPSARRMRDRIGQIDRALASDRFASAAEKVNFAKVIQSLGRLTADLERENPKAEALAALLKEAPQLAVLSDVPRETSDVQPMHGAVVTHWLGRARMPRILMPPLALPLYLLLYAPERRWFRGYLEATRRSSASVPDDQKRKVVFPGVASAWGSGTSPESPHDDPRDRARWQCRANVLYETGLALALSRTSDSAKRKRSTLIAVAGPVRLPSDFDGRVLFHLTNEPQQRRRLRQFFVDAGCAVNDDSDGAYLSPKNGNFDEAAMGVTGAALADKNPAGLDPRAIDLVLGPGGVRCIAFTGAIAELQRRGFTIAGICGVSAGSLVAAIIAAGVTPDQLVDIVRTGDLFSHIRPPGFWGGMRALFAPYAAKAPIEADIFRRIVRGDPRFGGLPIQLGIAALDLSKGRLLAYTSRTHPDMKVADALALSTAVPFFYPARHVDPDRLVVDAAVQTHIPLWLPAALGTGRRNRVIALSVGSSRFQKPKDFGSYLGRIVEASVIASDRLQVLQSRRLIRLRIPVEDYGPLDRLTKEQRGELIRQGEAAVEEALANGNLDSSSRPPDLPAPGHPQDAHDRAESEASAAAVRYARELQQFSTEVADE
jgi:predicted acylesterase/phospholipase RssA